MRSRIIGGRALRLTDLGFGGAPIGNLYRVISDEQALDTVYAAWDAGVRYFDTAPHYGLGLSEHRLGVALAHKPRGEFVISTKVGKVLVPNPQPRGSDLAHNGFAVADDLIRKPDFTESGVLRSIDQSLQRLGMDRIDIALVHDPQLDMNSAVEQATPALLKLRAEGVISAVGVGANSVQEASRFIEETDIDVVLLAGRWTLLERDAGTFLDRCAELGVSVLAAAPFNSGLLAAPWPTDDGHYDYGAPATSVLAKARAMAQLCRDHGDLLPHAAIRFPLRHGAVLSVIVGMASADEAIANAAWLAAPVSDDLWHALDELRHTG